MELYITGLNSGYEVENVARLFFPAAHLTTQCPQEGDRILARAGEELEATLSLNGTQISRTAPLGENPSFGLASLVYDLAEEVTGIRPSWGKMTGVRPVRIIHDNRRRGLSEEEIRQLFCDHYDCTPEKYRLALEIADLQRPIMTQSGPRDYSLYVGIPFCPSRCSYCSFVSRTTGKDGKLTGPYVDKLCEELKAFRDQANKNGLRLRTIYMGGGTPTSITAPQLRQLMGTIRDLFDLSQVEEYTVEAGRPDCTDREKLEIIKEYGATRISINPQTFSDQVLAAIGRKHTAQDILDCYRTARQVGHTNINMDLIAGLPGDTVEGFAQSLKTAIDLDPENITVHTLTLKRASNLVIEKQAAADAGVAAMLEQCSMLAQAGYRPYYLYRQKGTLQNLENTGWCKPGHEGLYNIYIMEEVHSILSAGAGGSTKLVDPASGRIQRIFNYKYPQEYLEGFGEILRRKEGVSEFYGKDMA